MSSRLLQQLPIDTHRLRIRRFRQEDGATFAEFMTDATSTAFLEFGGEEQRTEAGAKALIQTTIDAYDSEQPLLAFAVEALPGGAFVGFCGLHPHDSTTVEIMYAVMPSARKRGYATEIAKTLGHAALDVLDYSRVVAPIDLNNEFSCRAALKAGFVDQGPIKGEEPARLKHNYVLEKKT